MPVYCNSNVLYFRINIFLFRFAKPVHKNVIAFLTHGGIAGLYEAIHCAKPIISVPLFGDQSSNTAILEELGVAIRLNIDAISREAILNALNDIVNDTR